MVEKAFDHRLIELDELPDELQSVHATWNAARGRAFAPSRRAFDLLSIPVDHIPFTSVTDYDAEGDDFIIRFFGTGLVAIDGCEMTGKHLNETPHPALRETLLKLFRRVVDEKHENFAEFSYGLPGRPAPMSLTGRWPLSEDGAAVTGILSVIHPYQIARELNEILGHREAV